MLSGFRELRQDNTSSQKKALFGDWDWGLSWGRCSFSDKFYIACDAPRVTHLTIDFGTALVIHFNLSLLPPYPESVCAPLVTYFTLSTVPL
jgi:hypothetical protein